uniref:Uncharacterized protein n=1 Tax=Arundo donax TaxID=35708 RepID=A0A0A9A442_ARUDO
MANKSDVHFLRRIAYYYLKVQIELAMLLLLGLKCSQLNYCGKHSNPFYYYFTVT